jgi:hypothetical protein
MVARPRLTQRLDEGLRSGQRLFLVLAPAGYGKTTLITNWLTKTGMEYFVLVRSNQDCAAVGPSVETPCQVALLSSRETCEARHGIPGNALVVHAISAVAT